jgi:hypothetical protein
MGRDAKKVNLVIRITPNERTKLKAEAKRRGMSIAAVVMEPWRED